MDWFWFILYALGAAVAAYYILGIVAAAVISSFQGGMRDDRGRVRYVSGETIVLPPEPEREQPRKRWRITIERL